MSPIFKTDSQNPSSKGDPVVRTEPDFWEADGVRHIDVRGMTPPGPAVAILTLLDELGAGAEIIAHIDREPVLLLPDLDERGRDYELHESDGPGVAFWIGPGR